MLDAIEILAIAEQRKLEDLRTAALAATETLAKEIAAIQQKLRRGERPNAGRINTFAEILDRRLADIRAAREKLAFLHEVDQALDFDVPSDETTPRGAGKAD